MVNEVTVTELKDIELNLGPIKKRKRFKRSCEGEDADIIELFEVFVNETVHLRRGPLQLHKQPKEPKFPGKPLKIKRPKGRLVSQWLCDRQLFNKLEVFKNPN